MRFTLAILFIFSANLAVASVAPECSQKQSLTCSVVYTMEGGTSTQSPAASAHPISTNDGENLNQTWCMTYISIEDKGLVLEARLDDKNQLSIDLTENQVAKHLAFVSLPAGQSYSNAVSLDHSYNSSEGKLEKVKVLEYTCRAQN